jgi:hypothetical protein
MLTCKRKTCSRRPKNGVMKVARFEISPSQFPGFLTSFVISIVLTGCQTTMPPSVTIQNDTGSLRLPACSSLTFAGHFLGLRQAYAVSADGERSILNNVKPTGIHDQYSAELSDLKIGTYRVGISQVGGSSGLSQIAPGEAVSNNSFEVTTEVVEPRVSLRASKSQYPGDDITLTPTIIGPATSATFVGEQTSALNGSVHVHFCSSRGVLLVARNQCAESEILQQEVKVPAPTIAAVQSSIVAGETISIHGAGFSDSRYCGFSQVILFSKESKRDPMFQTATSGDSRTATVTLNSCIVAGRYDLVVRTKAGDSAPVPLVVRGATSADCTGR